jgi:hypothetical protein
MLLQDSFCRMMETHNTGAEYLSWIFQTMVTDGLNKIRILSNYLFEFIRAGDCERSLIESI